MVLMYNLIFSLIPYIRTESFFTALMYQYIASATKLAINMYNVIAAELAFMINAVY